MVQDFTAWPSTSTVQAPQLVVSQPIWVPVRPTPRRIRWDSSSRGSTSAIFFSPLIENLIRRIGTLLVASSPRSSYTMVMSGRPFRRVVGAGENALDKRRHHVPLVLGAAAVIGSRLRRRGGEAGG